MKPLLPYALSLVFFIIFGCKTEKKEKYIAKINPDWETVQLYYVKHIDEAIQYMDELKEIGFASENAKSVFKKLRIAFKKAEPYASYLNPEVGHSANGPALPIFKEDNGEVLAPVGLQKIEESIYDGEVSVNEFNREIEITKELINNLKENVERGELGAKHFFVATHQQLLRIITHGISGFDTPVSHLGIEESAISLESLFNVYQQSIGALVKEKDPKLNEQFEKHITDAVTYLNKSDDFENFDRFEFIRSYFNPITRDWLAIRKTSELWDGSNSYPFNFDAPTFFEDNTFNETYFTPSVNQKKNIDKIALGKKLFFDPNLSKKGDMACATCHIPEKAYADGMVVNLDNTGQPLQRNTPTLINSIYQKSYFWDGRSPDILAQISEVFNNEKEFNSGVHRFSKEILKDTTYQDLFLKAFGRMSTKNDDVVKALSAYVATLNGFNSKFDKNIRGEEDTFTEEEKLGFNLFMGKALCATCHFMPLTNGTVPPFFAETEKEVIGVPETAKNERLDDDLGFYWKFNQELHKGMFKTPTVRNAALTAPYMHNGVYSTLEEVMDFYNKGGGGGMGFDLQHQTLPLDNLNLNQKELDALVAYVKTLSDTNVEAEY